MRMGKGHLFAGVALLLVGGLLFLAPWGWTEKESKVADLDGLRRWVADPSNGLVRSHRVSDVSFRFTHLPAEFLARREMRRGSFDGPEAELRERYDSTLTFHLGVSPEEGKNEASATGRELLYSGVTSERDYRARSHMLNFGMKDRVRLVTGGEKYRPVLYDMSNGRGISGEQGMLFVFAPDTRKDSSFYMGKEVEIVYKDPLFQAGVLRFAFERSDLDRVPGIRGEVQNRGS